MSGYLIDKSDYYKGNYTQFGVNQVVAKAGGSQSHINLFNFILTPSFSTVSILNNKPGKAGIFFDNRAVQSMLFLFEPRVQLLFSVLLYREDIKIKEGLQGLEGTYYNVQYNIPSIGEVLNLSKSITKINFGSNILNALDNPFGNRWEDKLKFILCIKTKDKLFSSDDVSVEQCIRRLIKVVNIDSPYLEQFIKIAKDANRIQAAAIIGQRLGYNNACIQSITTTIERWLLSNI